MKRERRNKNMEIQTLEEIKERYYGKRGTDERDRIERELEALRIGFQIRNAREKKDMTQAELAGKIEKKRSFISKIENDGSNMTVKTLFDIVEYGLGGKLKIEVCV
jgi:ribosome-binding protein aMBF1 (putative translation factor)